MSSKPAHRSRWLGYCAQVRRETILNQGWQYTCAAWQVGQAKLGTSALEWLPATVPGHVHSDLVNSGIIADPYQRLHELGCQWVDEQEWQYRTTFTFKPDARLPRRILKFCGLDTVCWIFLNGKLIRACDNMFVEHEIDVSNRLIAGENQLLIEFDSANMVGRERRRRYFDAEGLGKETVRFEPRAFVRKAQYMFGWDWGPCLASAGIWRPVTLIEYAARIVDVRVVQRHLPDGAVELQFFTEHEGRGHAYHFVEGFDAPVRDGEALRLSQPRLWWPRDLGPAELYGVTSILTDAAPTSDEDTWIVLDQRNWRIGLRTIELVRQADNAGECFRFRVNGHDVYALGANWIPDDSLPSRVDPTRVHRQLQNAFDLGMNMLRVWGGGLYESDEFYDQCDQLGLLVWQDFPYACSYYPDGPSECADASAEVVLAVKRLRNHPSLAIWCGNNENQTMRECGWDGPNQHPPRYYGQNLYDRTIPELLRDLDPTRPYIPTSPTGRVEANSGGDGDQHFWNVWHGRGDWMHYADSTARFCSEFGFASAPSPKAWRQIEPNAQISEAPVRHPFARWHDKTGKGYEAFLAFVELHYPQSQTIEDWIYHSQLNQRNALRFGIEHFRRSAFCRGALVWQLNDCWPVQSWSVIDSAHQLKAAAYELRRVYAPLLTCVERVGEVLRWWAILDNSLAAPEAAFVLEVRRLLDGELLERHETNARLNPGERRILDSLDISRYDPTAVMVTTEVEGRVGCSLLCEPKQLKLTAPELVIRPAHTGVSIEVGQPVLDLYLDDDTGECTFVDNFVTFVNPGSHIVRCSGTPKRLTARSLAGFHAVRFR